jgi:hypothetical protein
MTPLLPRSATTDSVIRHRSRGTGIDGIHRKSLINPEIMFLSFSFSFLLNELRQSPEILGLLSPLQAFL